MSRILTLFTIITLIIFSVAVAVVFGQNPIIDIGKCTDTLFCRQETCSMQPAATGQCVDASNSSAGTVASQVLICNPEMMTCGELWTFSDKFCTVPLFSQAFVCGECDPSKNQNAQCWMKNGVESLAIQVCDDNKCSSNCKTQQEVPRGQCIPTQNGNGETIYLKYDGAVMCNTVDQVIWQGTSSCKGSVATITQLPTQHCIDGTVLDCKFSNSSRSRQTLGGSPCPKQDVHKLKCALAIAECVAECVADDWEGCVKCIIEKVGEGDLKECCQTVSHYAHFDCTKCNYLENNSSSVKKN